MASVAAVVTAIGLTIGPLCFPDRTMAVRMIAEVLLVRFPRHIGATCGLIVDLVIPVGLRLPVNDEMGHLILLSALAVGCSTDRSPAAAGLCRWRHSLIVPNRCVVVVPSASRTDLLKNAAVTARIAAGLFHILISFIDLGRPESRHRHQPRKSYKSKLISHACV